MPVSCCQKCPLPRANPCCNYNTRFIGLREAITQTVSRSVQSFMQGSRESSTDTQTHRRAICSNRPHFVLCVRCGLNVQSYWHANPRGRLSHILRLFCRSVNACHSASHAWTIYRHQRVDGWSRFPFRAPTNRLTDKLMDGPEHSLQIKQELGNCWDRNADQWVRLPAWCFMSVSRVA